MRDVEAIAAVHVAAWHRAFRGIISDEEIEKRNVERRIEQWSRILQARDRVVLVACDDSGAIQGFGSAVATPGEIYQSYLETLYVSPDRWNHGIGSALLSGIAARLRDAGVNTMALRTLRLGTARAFYERCGAHQVTAGIAREAHTTFDDVVYAFDDLAALAVRVPPP